MKRVLVTITVVDHGKIITGSSVQQLGCRPANRAYGGLDVGGCYINGDAAYVRLNDGTYLFLPFAAKYGSDWEGYVHAILNQHEPSDEYGWDVPEDEQMRLVGFRDVTNPQSIFEVLPNSEQETLGKDVSVGRIHVSTTDQRVKAGQINAILPWLKTLDQASVNGSKFDRNAFTGSH